MNEYKDFFAASVGAAAALIGLLFVAITIAPERVFGASADSTRRGQAIGAFVALGNVFFVSLAGMLPHVTAQVVVVLAAGAAFQIARESVVMARLFPECRGLHFYGRLSLCIYALEAVIALRVLFAHAPFNGVAYTVLGLYGYALATSWALLGSRDAAKSGVR